MATVWKKHYASNEQPPQWWVSLEGDRCLVAEGVFDESGTRRTFFTEQEARLIGAAPEMADVLRRLARWWDGITPLSPHDTKALWDEVTALHLRIVRADMSGRPAEGKREPGASA